MQLVIVGIELLADSTVNGRGLLLRPVFLPEVNYILTVGLQLFFEFLRFEYFLKLERGQVHFRAYLLDAITL